MTLQSEDMVKLVAVLWGCADGNGIDERYVFREKAVADHVAGLYGLTVVPLYARPAHREAQPETDGGGEIEAIRQSVLDLCKGHPHAKIAWPHRELHAIADRLAALQPTPEGQTEGAVVTVPVDVVQRAIRWLRRPKNDLNSYAVADDLRAALASKGV